MNPEIFRGNTSVGSLSPWSYAGDPLKVPELLAKGKWLQLVKDLMDSNEIKYQKGSKIVICDPYTRMLCDFSRNDLSKWNKQCMPSEPLEVPITVFTSDTKKPVAYFRGIINSRLGELDISLVGESGKELHLTQKEALKIISNNDAVLPHALLEAYDTFTEEMKGLIEKFKGVDGFNSLPGIPRTRRKKKGGWSPFKQTLKVSGYLSDTLGYTIECFEEPISAEGVGKQDVDIIISKKNAKGSRDYYMVEVKGGNKNSKSRRKGGLIIRNFTKARAHNMPKAEKYASLVANGAKYRDKGIIKGVILAFSDETSSLAPTPVKVSELVDIMSAVTIECAKDDFLVLNISAKKAAEKNELILDENEYYFKSAELAERFSSMIGSKKEDVTRVIYPASHYDAKTILACIKVFPNIREVVAVTSPLGLGVDAEKMWFANFEHLAKIYDIDLSGIDIKLILEDYYKIETLKHDISHGKTVLIDKFPGRNSSMRENPLFKLSILRDLNAGDLVLTRKDILTKPLKWANEPFVTDATLPYMYHDQAEIDVHEISLADFGGDKEYIDESILTPETAARRHIGDLDDINNISLVIQESLKTFTDSGRGIVIALENNLMANSDIDLLVKSLNNWKEDQKRENPRLAERLENLTINSFKDKNSLISKLGNDNGNNERDIFVFTRDKNNTDIPFKRVIPVVFNLPTSIPDPLKYCPVPEVVLLALTADLYFLDAKALIKSVKGGMFKLNGIGINDITDNEGYLIFDILPAIERFPGGGQVDRFNKLLTFLRNV